MKKLNYIILLNLMVFQVVAQELKEQEDWITIFVHGCVALRSNFNIKTFRRLLRDDISGSTYEKNVLNVRNKKFLFTLQPMQECGLVEVKNYEQFPSAAYSFSKLLDQQNKYWSFNQKNKYYTYGWSGLLSNKEREKAAELFYIAIKNELEKLKSQGLNPKIRIIGYSHGALVSFNLAKIRRTYFKCDTFKVDELITLGMPVHNTTYDLIDKNMFRQIYHIYSKSDYVQRIDIFGPCRFFSQKRFYGPLPDNITQIELRITAKLLRTKCTCIPSNMRGTVEQSPGHMEMWFFGWAPRGYRKNFTLYPLPASSLIPYLIRTANDYACHSRNLKVDIRPDQEITIIKTRDCSCREIVPFISITDFTALKWYAIKFHPGQEKYVKGYIKLQQTIDPEDYK